MTGWRRWSALGLAGSLILCAAGLCAGELNAGELNADEGRRAEPVPQADAEVAAELSRSAQQALTAGDEAEAAHRLLSALRWDPGRLADYRQAVALLADLDIDAAVRHAAVLLREDPDFGADDVALLSRLAAAADKQDTVESAAYGAQFFQRLAETAGKSRQVAPWLLAGYWRDAGELYASADEVEAASAAFEKMQKLVLATPASVDSRGMRWEVVAGWHLKAEEPDRAAVAIEALARRGGETPELLTLRARLARQLGEALAAADHAWRAIEARDRGAEGDLSPYGIYLDAMRDVNQADHARQRLEERAKSRPDDWRLAIAVVDACRAADQSEQAWRFSGRVTQRLLERLPARDALLGVESDDDQGAGYEALADLTERRLDLALQLDRPGDWLAEAPAVADRLDGLFGVYDSILKAAQDPLFRRAASEWIAQSKSAVESTVETDANLKLAAGLDRAASLIAVDVGLPGDAVFFIRSTLQRALDAGADPLEIVEEFNYWLFDLKDRDADHAANELAQWGTENLLPRIDKGGAAPIAAARLRAELAWETSRQDFKDEALQEAAYDRAERWFDEAVALAPDDGGVATGSLFQALYAGRFDKAVTEGERTLQKWTKPDPEAGIDDERFELASVWTAAALLARDGAGDSGAGDHDRAVELLERVLDRSPEDPSALVTLGESDLTNPDHHARAARLARQVARLRPEWADPPALLGALADAEGRHAEAAEHFADAIRAIDAGAPLCPWQVEAIRAAHTAALQAAGRAEEAAAGAPAP
ncbi:hypothetical protein Pla108_00570 [Botrimarina colliarenosi]|uniref:Uncharacterized protein n=1 Tax=Botrimarina colliarenosi TaxID=2528001 RepID=A0A5C6AGM6_9BACT|nr:hypothetical protein [Botrimarina colliarenosi]TWT99124.1 hypothetical protein Pla108_00570 [Botrimarina colliarenosi]